MQEVLLLIRFVAVRNVGEIPHEPTLVRAAHARTSACFCAYLEHVHMRFSGASQQRGATGRVLERPCAIPQLRSRVALARRSFGSYALSLTPQRERAQMTALSFTVNCSGDGSLRSTCGTVVIGMGECLSYVSDGCHLCALLVGLNASGSCTVVQWESASEFIVEEDGMPILHTCQPARRPSPFELLQVYDVETSFDINIGQVMQKARVLDDKEWVTLCSSLEHGDIPRHTYFSRYMRVRQNTKQGIRKVFVAKHPMQPVDEFWGRWQLVFNKDEPMLVSTEPRKMSEQSRSQPCTTFDEDREYLTRLLWSSRLTGKAMSGKTPYDP